MITPQTDESLSPQELLETNRREMQRDSGKGDMQDVQSHLSNDSLPARHMPIDGAD